MAFKASADSYKGQTVEAYNRSSCTGSDICYTYEGSGWLQPAITLSLAYVITGDTGYRATALQLLDAMNASWNTSSDLTPITLDDGYPTRNVLPAIAIIYDWLYSSLSSTEKTQSIATINAAYALWAAGTTYYQQTGPAYSNYFGGHMLGFGLGADATDGDNSSSTTIYNTMEAAYTGQMTYGLQADPPVLYSGNNVMTSGFNGGWNPQGYNYGTNHNIRMWQLLWAWQTSGRNTTLITTYTPWMENSVTNMLYATRPDLWRAGDEGDAPGDCTGSLYQDYPLFMAYMLNGTMAGAWSQYFFLNMTPSLCDPSLFVPAPYEALLWQDWGRFLH